MFSVIEEIRRYADERKSDVARGVETPALAALMVEKFGEGMGKLLSAIASLDGSFMKEVDKLVHEIDPDYSKHRQSRLDARPAGLAINGEVL